MKMRRLRRVFRVTFSKNRKIEGFWDDRNSPQKRSYYYYCTGPLRLSFAGLAASELCSASLPFSMSQGTIRPRPNAAAAAKLERLRLVHADGALLRLPDRVVKRKRVGALEGQKSCAEQINVRI